MHDRLGYFFVGVYYTTSTCGVSTPVSAKAIAVPGFLLTAPSTTGYKAGLMLEGLLPRTPRQSILPKKHPVSRNKSRGGTCFSNPSSFSAFSLLFFPFTGGFPHLASGECCCWSPVASST